MSAPTAMSCKHSFRFFHTPSTRLNPLKSISFPYFPASKLVFSVGFDSRERQSKRRGIFKRNIMDEEIGPSAFRRSNGDEGISVLEQETLINGDEGFVSDGLESTLNRLSKWLVAGLFSAVIIWRHDAEALWAAMGSVLNAGLSLILKQILNQERPISTPRSDPGMPSSHAQSVFYTAMFAIMSLVEWLGMNVLTMIISGFALAFGSYFSWLRVSQRLHTISQVVVGAAVGSIFSILWFWSWNAIVLDAFVSSLWVQIFVMLAAAGFCMGFLLYVIRYWLKDER